MALINKIKSQLDSLSDEHDKLASEAKNRMSKVRDSADDYIEYATLD